MSVKNESGSVQTATKTRRNLPKDWLHIIFFARRLLGITTAEYYLCRPEAEKGPQLKTLRAAWIFEAKQTEVFAMPRIIIVPTSHIPREARTELSYPLEAVSPPVRVIVHEDMTLKGLGYVEIYFDGSPFNPETASGAANALGQLAALKWPEDDCMGWFMDGGPFAGYSRMVNGERSYVPFPLVKPSPASSRTATREVHNKGH